MIERAVRPVCAAHPDQTVVAWGWTLGSRRRRWKCEGGDTPHTPIHGQREDLIGVCLACERGWEHGYPIAAGAWFHVSQVVVFLRSVGSGASVGLSMREARAERQKVLSQRARIAGVPAPAWPPPIATRSWFIAHLNRTVTQVTRPEEDARTGADWLGRYGAPFVAATLDREWPDAPLLVDSTKFQLTGIVYPAGHPRAGQPKRGGATAFVVMAAGVREPGGAFRIVHCRAMLDESEDSWEMFFRSLPGRPSKILADQWWQIRAGADRVWSGIVTEHSIWHAWDLIRRRFNRAHWYPGTHELVADGPAAFVDPTLFTTWRAQAATSAPKSVTAWLTRYGDAHLARISGPGPYATGPIEAFLRAVGNALYIGRGRIGNLARLDIRLGLLAAHANRKDDADVMLAQVIALLDSKRLAFRELDSAPFDSTWILDDFPKP